MRYSLLRTVPILFLLLTSCSNNPYRKSDETKNIYYSTFNEPPKYFDPAKSYSSDEYVFIEQIYEPPMSYHYLKRPYELVPLTAEKVPVPKYSRKNGKLRIIYEIKIKKGIAYQNHPCFARDREGNAKHIYHNLTSKDVRGIFDIKDFKYVGTRELVAKDYVYQIKRMADPRLHCPILSVMIKYILGLNEYTDKLSKDLEEERKERRKIAGAAYNQEMDEQKNPIKLDLNKYEIPGVKDIDRYTYQIILKSKYPQILYWLAMPFFCPMPEEAVDFYSQGVLVDRNIILDRYPVGTGPYRIEVYDTNRHIILTRNENYREDFYPEEGEGDDGKKGLLKDKGKHVPFIDKAVYVLEKEYIPRWNKFLQGYYDSSGISSDSFDQAIQYSPQGEVQLTDFIIKKNIQLLTATTPLIFYFGFNMLDPVVGGYDEKKQKLRQAISIAIDCEEYIQIFANGRGIPSHSPLPPGIFGYEKGRQGINPYVYNWDSEKNKSVRKSLDKAKKLLAEAGYPGGKDRQGRPLVIGFDNAWVGPGATSILQWLYKKLKNIGIEMEIRTTDYNRFREKMRTGNFQMFRWGWHADYPDPENFMFLLYGKNSKVKHGGENAANYNNPEFNRLFKLMETMENSPERLKIIRRMKKIVRKDSPWIWGHTPVDFGLYHQWYKNAKPASFGYGTLKYKRIDPFSRKKFRNQWNKPVILPVIIFAGIIILTFIPAFIFLKRGSQ